MPTILWVVFFNFPPTIYKKVTLYQPWNNHPIHSVVSIQSSVMCQLPTGTNYRKSRANYRHIVYVWSTDKFTERGRAISGRSIEAYPPVFDFARVLDSEALSKAISHSLGCK